MLVAPDELTEAELVLALERGWGLTVISIEYLAVGWGSHHWDVCDAAGSRWFVTADELEAKRLSASESLATGFSRLRASLAAARALRDCGRSFVVAPVPTCDGALLVRVGARFALAVYPFVHGQTFRWGEPYSAEDRQAVLAMVTAVHTAPPMARDHALADEFAVPYRDDLEAACDPSGVIADCGPCAGPAADLIRRHAAAIGRQLARYDALVARARSLPASPVLTHGEPHPGNTMLTADGWRLLDWDTVLVAPPERDLWHLDPGDGSVLDAYAEATGRRPLPPLLDLYRLRWDLTDVALGVARFRRPHAGSIEDDKAWNGLCTLIEQLSD